VLSSRDVLGDVADLTFFEVERHHPQRLAELGSIPAAAP